MLVATAGLFRVYFTEYIWRLESGNKRE